MQQRAESLKESAIGILNSAKKIKEENVNVIEFIIKGRSDVRKNAELQSINDLLEDPNN